jgi:hypothetical protein
VTWQRGSPFSSVSLLGPEARDKVAVVENDVR